VEYQIKWSGYPDSQNTWEKGQDVYCVDLIKKFEEEMEADSEEKPTVKRVKRNTTDNGKRKRSGSVNDKNLQSKRRRGDIGFETGYKVDTIIGAKKEEDGELYLYVSWIGTDGYCSFIPAKLAHKRFHRN